VLLFAGWLIGRRVDTLRDALDSLTSAGLAFGALCAAPVFFYLTWQQAGAKDRLIEARLPVSPDFGRVVGAQGGRAPRNVWRFELGGEPADLFAGYERAAREAGWKVERRPNGLLLTRDGAGYGLWCEQHRDGPQAVIEPHPRRRG